MIIPQTKFEAIISKNVGGERHASQQILDLSCYNFLPVTPMVMTMVFMKSQCRELSENVYFYPLLTYIFLVIIHTFFI